MAADDDDEEEEEDELEDTGDEEEEGGSEDLSDSGDDDDELLSGDGDGSEDSWEVAPEALRKDGTAQPPSRTRTKEDAKAAQEFADDIDAELQALEAEDGGVALTAEAKSGEEADDATKAQHVHNQLLLGEAVLEARIRLQGPLLACNRLPPPELFAAALAQPGMAELRDAALQTRNDLAALILDLNRLRQRLAARNRETIGLGKRRRDNDADADSDESMGEDGDDSETDALPALRAMLPAGVPALGRRKARMVDESDLPKGFAGEDELMNPLDAAEISSDALWKSMRACTAATAAWRKDTIDSWGRKLAFASGLTAKKAVKLRVMNADISEQVAQSMQDVERLKARSRPRARDVQVYGLPAGEQERESDAALHDCYDDSEFYQQLLKDFVASSAALADDAAAAPKKLTSVKREGIDRRATKGRRLKFNVHPKLVNFMAPAPFVVPPEMAFDLDTVVASLFKASG